MTTAKFTSAGIMSGAACVGYSENTDARLRAYLASVQPVPDVEWSDNRPYHRGRSLIERLALSAKGDDPPTLMLSASDCADVACFISRSFPIDPETWWNDPKDAPSQVVGFMFVLDAIENSLREVRNARAASRKRA